MILASPLSLLNSTDNSLFQTNHQVELLTKECDRLVSEKEEQVRENRMREKERYVNTLAKLRSEGLCRYIISHCHGKYTVR